LTACTTLGACALGCGEITLESTLSLLSATSNETVQSPTECLTQCQPFSATYHSLFEYSPDIPILYMCSCYSSTYVFTPKTADDENCTIIQGINYGVNSNAQIGPPGSEYVYII
jgi:hypothetical protein